jgi:hypothetical protein
MPFPCTENSEFDSRTLRQVPGAPLISSEYITDENDASAMPVFSPVATHIFWSEFHAIDRADVSNPPSPLFADAPFVFVPIMGRQFDAPEISNVRIKQHFDASTTPELGTPAAIQTPPLYAIEYTCDKIAPVPATADQFAPETSVEMNNDAAEFPVPLLVPPASHLPADDALTSS